MVKVVLHTDISYNRRRGWSLIELLVVLAIISILGLISVPVMRTFARNDMRDGARSVYTLLRAARMYAMNYNVQTAVVYSLDSDFLTDTPLVDSLRDHTVRAIRGAQVMYQLPEVVGLHPQVPESVNIDENEEEIIAWRLSGTFVPVPTSAGELVTFPEGYALLLEAMPREAAPLSPPTQVYMADRPEAQLWERALSDDPLVRVGAHYLTHYHRRLENENSGIRHHDGHSGIPGLERLGMKPVYVFTGTLMDYSDAEIMEAQPTVHPRMAHVFAPRGNLDSLQSAERYRLWFGPSPDTYYTERIWFVGDEPDQFMVRAWLDGLQPLSERGNLIGIPIDIHRATGRATMGPS